MMIKILDTEMVHVDYGGVRQTCVQAIIQVSDGDWERVRSFLLGEKPSSGDWKEFFKGRGAIRLHDVEFSTHCTIEELYNAFRMRFLAELMAVAEYGLPVK